MISTWKVNEKWKMNGPNRGLNPGPLAPKARIIPLDHSATFSYLRIVLEILEDEDDISYHFIFFVQYLLLLFPISHLWNPVYILTAEWHRVSRKKHQSHWGTSKSEWWQTLAPHLLFWVMWEHRQDDSETNDASIMFRNEWLTVTMSSLITWSYSEMAKQKKIASIPSYCSAPFLRSIFWPPISKSL